MKKEKLEFHTLILHKLNVVSPINIFFTIDLYQWTIGFDGETIFD